MFRFRVATGRRIILLTNLAFERQRILMSFSLPGGRYTLSRTHAETHSLMSVPCTFLISHTELSQASNAAAIRDRRGKRKEIFFCILLFFSLSLLSLALRLRIPLRSHSHAGTDLREQRTVPPTTSSLNDPYVCGRCYGLEAEVSSAAGANQRQA